MAEFDKVQTEFRFLIKQLEMRLTEWERELETAGSDADLDQHMPAITTDINEHHRQMKELVSDLDKSQQHALKTFYRERLNRFWAQGEITNRCLEKPRGYHGDFVTMRLMYENAYSGDTNLGKCLHKYVTEDSSSASVRGRRSHLIQRVRDAADGEPGAIFSVASGPATEVVDALKAGVKPSRIVLLDQDYESLKFAEAEVRKVLPKGTDLALMNVAIADLVMNGDEDLEKLAPFNFIYSAGLYDYLPDQAAKMLNWYLAKMLAPGGILEIGNFTDFPIGFFSDYASGWRLILRGPKQIEKTIPDGLETEYRRIGGQTFVAMTDPSKPTETDEEIVIRRDTDKSERASS